MHKPSYAFGGKHANSLAQIPAGEHWVVLEESSIYIPGDQRSRDCPGHGYGESTQTYLDYVFFTDEANFKKYIEHVMTPDRDSPYPYPRQLRLFYVKPVTAKVNVSVVYTT